jgi:CHAT domain-containing protein/Tfp pilus assembly protein PilF
MKPTFLKKLFLCLVHLFYFFVTISNSIAETENKQSTCTPLKKGALNYQFIQQAEHFFKQTEVLINKEEHLQAAKMYKKFIFAEECNLKPNQAKEMKTLGILDDNFSKITGLFSKPQLYNYALGYYDKALLYADKCKDRRRIAYYSSKICNLYKLLGDSCAGEYTKATVYYKKAIENTNNNEEKIELFNRIGKVYGRKGDYEAITYFKQSLKLARKVKDNEKILRSLMNIGLLNNYFERSNKALLSFKEAIAISIKTENKNNFLKCLKEISSLFSTLKQHEKIMPFNLEILEKVKENNNNDLLSMSYYNIGEVYVSKGKPEKALTNFQQSLNISLKTNQGEIILKCLERISWAFNILGRPREKNENFNKILEYINEHENIAINKKLYEYIGSTCESLLQINEALKYYQKALALDKLLHPNELFFSSNFERIRNIYISLMQYDKLEEHYNNALLAVKRQGDLFNIGVGFSIIGNSYKALGLYNKAIEIFNGGLVFFANNNEKSTDYLVEIGKIYISLGSYDKANTYFEKAIEGASTTNQRLCNLKISIGQSYGGLGQYEKSISFFQEALKIAQENYYVDEIAFSLLNIGTAYYNMGEKKKALPLFKEALERSKKINDKSIEYSCINNMAGIYLSTGEYIKALKMYQDALSYANIINNVSSKALYLHNIGIVYLNLSLFDNAIKYFHDSIDIKEKIRKTAIGKVRRDYLASQIKTYQYLTSAYIRNLNPKKAFHSIEISRAKLLAERITHNKFSNTSIANASKIKLGLSKDEAVLIYSNVDHLKMVQIIITDNECVGTEISNKINLLKTKINYTDSVLARLEKKRGIQIVDRNKENHPTNNLAKNLEFKKFVDYYRILLVDSAHWTEKHDQYKQHLLECSQALYEILIKPIEAKVVNKKKLTIVPDGILGFIPFETLVDEEGKYLIEKYDICYTQSMTILDLIKKRNYSNTRMPLLAFGGAIYNESNHKNSDNNKNIVLDIFQKKVSFALKRNSSLKAHYKELGMTKWNNLPGTLTEVKLLKNIFNNAKVFTGEKVSESNIKALSENNKLTQYKIIHFATHGLVVPSLPELSAIVLSQFNTKKSEEDGFLRMGEIEKLNINADFVNLSACETGLGKIFKGEGVVGLNQSFLIAGANGLSVSLWSVDDNSTAKFMESFYKMVSNKNICYKKAISQIKRRFIKGDFGQVYKVPYYWAPFVYYGK